jgi:hypothetical protein
MVSCIGYGIDDECDCCCSQNGPNCCAGQNPACRRKGSEGCSGWWSSQRCQQSVAQQRSAGQARRLAQLAGEPSPCSQSAFF